MKRIPAAAITEYELVILDMAEIYEVKTAEDLERFSQILHEHLEIALSDHADCYNIDDYNPQY